jgi:23S rRNA (guanosine2251-2'-O)-methyltransferase
MTKSFWIAGKHAVIESIKNPKRKVIKVIGPSNSDLEELSKERKIIFEEISNSKVRKLLESESINHQNYLALIEELPKLSLKDLFEDSSISTLVLLDNITDTRNIGSIIRSCVCFGVDAIIVEKRVFKNSSVQMHKTASGAMEYINIIEVSNIQNALIEAKKNSFFIYGMDSNATLDISDMELSPKVAFVFGSEEKGLKNNIKNSCDYLIKIKNDNKITSLNVSNACSATLAISNHIKKRNK